MIWSLPGAANQSAPAHNDKSFTTHSDTGVLSQLRGALLCAARLNLTFLAPCPPTVASRHDSDLALSGPSARRAPCLLLRAKRRSSTPLSHGRTREGM
jgi:hypothetical protein